MNYFYQKTKAILTAALIAMTMTAHAAFVRNLPTEIKQPDGVTLHVLASGDEHYNWVHDQNNFTIIKNKATGYFVYATKVNGLLEPTEYVVGKVNPAQVGLIPGLLDDASVIKEKAAKSVIGKKDTKQKRTASGAEPAVRSTGDYNNIVVYIQFSDQASEQWTLTKAETESRFNGTGIVSIKDFYKEVSNNQLNINTTFYPQSSNVYPISYTDSHPRSYYQKDTPDGYATDPNGSTLREHDLLKNAINYVSSQVPSSLNIDGNNDGLVDNVVFVIKGYTEGWAELLWPHRWSLFSHDVYIGSKKVYDYNLVFGTSLGVGVISHELFHSFGAPDLYQYSAWNTSGAAVGPWDLMASEDWNIPQHMGAYMKQEYGKWTTIPEITTTGTYSLQPFSTNTFSSYKIKLPNTDDYLVLEYRKKEGKYEIMVPASGLIVSLIHPGGNNAGGPTNEVYTFHEGGTYTLSGDIYEATFGNGRNSFNDQTATFCFKSDGTPCGLGNAGLSNISVTSTGVTFNYTAPSVAACTTPAWNSTIAYTQGQEASYANNKYRARWWTQNNRPDLNSGTGQPWELLGPCGGTVNQVPIVTITAPAVASKFIVGGSVTVKANVTDTDGSVASVEIYSPHIPNSSVILTAPPYEATFSNLPSSGARGLTTFLVKATDNNGGINGASIDVTESKAPLLTITSPLPKYNNSSVVYTVGSSLTVSANATDADGIAKVEISLGSNAPVVKTAAPYTVAFTNLPAPAPDGSIYFTVKAYDNSGETTSQIIVAYKNRLPTVTIATPSSATPGSTINITTSANDVDGAIAKVEFYNGATKLGESTTAPYSFAIANAVLGSYSLTAKATDDLGQSTTSPAVTVTVIANSCSVAAWSSTPAYSTGNRVSKGGTVYEAKWWTQNNDPVTNSGPYDVWKVIGPCNARLSAVESLSTVTLSPVPFSDELSITIKEDQAHIELYDVFGTKVVQADGSGIVTLPTAACAPGLYLCKVFVNGESKSFTVVKR